MCFFIILRSKSIYIIILIFNSLNVLTEKRVIVSNKSCEEFPQFSLQISLKLCCDVETVLRCKSRISTYWIFKIMSLKYTKMSSKQKNISWQAWNSKSTPKTRIVLFARESCKDVAKEKLSRLFFSQAGFLLNCTFKIMPCLEPN